MMQRIPGLPELERGRRIRLQVLGCDYIELVFETRLLQVLDETETLQEDDVELMAEASETSETPETVAVENDEKNGEDT